MYYVRVDGSWLAFSDLHLAIENKEQARKSGQDAKIYVEFSEPGARVIYDPARIMPTVNFPHTSKHGALLENTANMQATKGPDLTALEEAKKIIYGDREKTYGHPAKNLEAIAGLWREYLNNMDYIHKVNRPLDAQDVAQMMILLKLARLQNQPEHRDSRVDLVGYAALIDRLHEKN